MSKTPGFPAFYYSPDGEAQIFQAASDVPEGWTTKHPNHQSDVAKPDPKPDLTPNPDKLTRDEIIAALNNGGIAYKKNAGTAALEAQLRESIKAFLTDTGVPELALDASTKELLTLLPKTPEPPKE
jgi:hypothetical protein